MLFATGALSSATRAFLSGAGRRARRSGDRAGALRGLLEATEAHLAAPAGRQIRHAHLAAHRIPGGGGEAHRLVAARAHPVLLRVSHEVRPIMEGCGELTAEGLGFR